MIELTLQTLALLAAAAFAAGFIDSIAGGGGLITVPALLLAGFPPVQALGTNKLQSLFGSASATLAYAAKGQVRPAEQWPAALASLIGSVAGALLATVLPSDWLRWLMPVMLVAIALYFALKRNLGEEDRAQRLTPLLFALTISPLIGFYDGLFGPGTGSFFMLAFVGLAGFGLLKATAHTKFLNFASNVGGFATFALLGVVSWPVGIAMGLAQFGGAQLGARWAVRGGARVIRPLLVLTCIVLAAKLLTDDAGPLRHWLGN